MRVGRKEDEAPTAEGMTNLTRGSDILNGGHLIQEDLLKSKNKRKKVWAEDFQEQLSEKRSLRKGVSFGVIGLGLGVTLLSYGFGAYFNILPGSEWSALMLTYGFPLAIIGMALKYAELKPVPCLTYSDAEKLRETCATPILKQVRNDVIRYRYGDEQHLEEALKRIFQYGLGGGIPRRSAPILQVIREEVNEDGKYCLVLVFEAKSLQLSDFERRQAKFASFFGPGITAEIGKGENDLYEVRLISDTTPQ